MCSSNLQQTQVNDTGHSMYYSTRMLWPPFSPHSHLFLPICLHVCRVNIIFENDSITEWQVLWTTPASVGQGTCNFVSCTAIGPSTTFDTFGTITVPRPLVTSTRSCDESGMLGESSDSASLANVRILMHCGLRM